MKLVTFSHLHRTSPDRDEGEDTHIGIYLPGGKRSRVLEIEAMHEWLRKTGRTPGSGGWGPKSGFYDPPKTMLDLLDRGPEGMDRLRGLLERIMADEQAMWECSLPADDLQLLAPVPFPRHTRLLRLRAARQDSTRPPRVGDDTRMV